MCGRCHVLFFQEKKLVLASSFQNARKADYEKIIQEANRLLANWSSVEGDQGLPVKRSAHLSRLKARLDETITIDFFNASERGTADILFKELEKVINNSKPVKIEGKGETKNLQRSTAGLLAMVVLVGMGERMAERFLPIYILALGGGVLAVGLLQAMDNFLSALYAFPGGYLSDRIGTKRSLLIFNLIDPPYSHGSWSCDRRPFYRRLGRADRYPPGLYHGPDYGCCGFVPATADD